MKRRHASRQKASVTGQNGIVTQTERLQSQEKQRQVSGLVQLGISLNGLRLSLFRPMTFCLMPFNRSPFRLMTFCLIPFNLSPFRPMTFWLMPFNLSPFRLMPNCTRPDTWRCFSWDLKPFSLSHDAVLSSDWSLFVWGTTPFHFMTEVWGCPKMYTVLYGHF